MPQTTDKPNRLSQVERLEQQLKAARDKAEAKRELKRTALADQITSLTRRMEAMRAKLLTLHDELDALTEETDV